jgi:hypothetical protein
LSEGDINELHVGLKGTMNTLLPQDLAVKTHRTRGRLKAGKTGGGNAYPGSHPDDARSKRPPRSAK